MYRKILIALQGNETDTAVLIHLQRLAALLRAEVTLLRVVAVADDGGGGLGRQFQLEVGSSGWRRSNEAEQYLAKLERQLRQRGLSVETAVVIGTRSEGDEIASYAVDNGHDLIAMASDPRPWYKRLLGGSPAGEVQREATVPTLFVSASSRELEARPAVSRANPVMAVLGSADL
jgi:nucleotide-binding universal stress UspA family protein